MRTAARSAARALGPLLFALLTAAPCAAGVVEVLVVDDEGRGVENVAVYAVPQSGGARVAAESDPSAPTAVMDQRDQEFVPHLLVVRRGSLVTFPNSDDVSHHVYSFSAAKTFELPLYKGDVYPPVLFDRTGIVVVGCNIHDGMLGYIVVVDTPHFTVTNERGVAVLDGVPDGAYLVEAWTPRARPVSLPAPKLVEAGAAPVAVELEISGRLAPPHSHGASSLAWDRY